MSQSCNQHNIGSEDLRLINVLLLTWSIFDTIIWKFKLCFTHCPNPSLHNWLFPIVCTFKPCKQPFCCGKWKSTSGVSKQDAVQNWLLLGHKLLKWVCVGRLAGFPGDQLNKTQRPMTSSLFLKLQSCWVELMLLLGKCFWGKGMKISFLHVVSWI